MKGALDGILVVSLEQAVAAPLATARLAAAGARVIKIERAEGDFARGYDHVVGGESAYFVWLNQGKESLVLDIKAPADAELLGRLVAHADIFVQNLAPGAAARTGFGSESLRARHPRLITCDISGYGDGPMADRRAYDLLIQCETGLASITGGVSEPGRVGVSVADIACGMNAHAAILEALIARGVSGKGRGIAVSLFDALAEWMTVPLLHHEFGGKAPARVGLQHPSIAPYGAFACSDGQLVVLAVQNEREWHRLCVDVLENPGLSADPRFASNSLRVANRAGIDAIVMTVFAGFPAKTVMARLDLAGIACAPVNEIADLSCHPHLRRHRISTPGGVVDLPVLPVIAGAPEPVRAVPALGAHTMAIRAEFAG